MQHGSTFYQRTALGAVLLFLAGGHVASVAAQERPSRRQTQTNVSSELLVSFEEDTSFDQFLRIINPVFERAAGKPVVDPEGRSMSIGVPISGMHFLDAFERVLEANQLTYQETDAAYVVQAPDSQEAQSGGASAGDGGEVPATLESREIRINAILFNVNLTEVRNRGLKWDELFPGQQGGQGGGGQGGGGQGGQGETVSRDSF